MTNSCVYCGNELVRDKYWQEKIENLRKLLPNTKLDDCNSWTCYCGGWSKEQENILMEEYNKYVNSVSEKREVKNLITCPSCENKYPMKSHPETYLSCGAGDDFCCPKEPCCSKVITVKCKVCNGEGYVNSTT